MGKNKKNKRWTAKRKLEVVLEGLKETKTVTELCRETGITQSMYYEWKNTLLERGEEALTYGGRSKAEHDKDKEIAQLQKKVGQLTIHTDILKKNLELRESRKRRLTN